MRKSLVALAAAGVLLAGALPTTADYSTAWVSPSRVAPGGSVAINFALELDTAQTVTVDVDVDTSAGQAIWRHQWAGQTFSSHQLRAYSTTWTVSSSQAAGNYYLVVKAFDSSGKQVYATGPVSPFSVISQTATASSPTPTPTRSVSASPTPSPSTTSSSPTPTPTNPPTSTTPTPTKPPTSSTPSATATPAPTNTPAPTSTPAVSSPSGEGMPLGDISGWHQVFSDDFTTNVSTGSFPSAVSGKWWAYPDGWPDSSHNGVYSPSQVLSVHDGVLDMYIHSSGGKHLVGAPVPRIPGAPGKEGGLQYGRYAVRFRADALHGYKTAWLLWPDSETWPRDGEIDFPEGNLDSTISAFMHRMNATSGSDQDAYSTSTTYTSWHTAVTEWTASSLKFYLDGRLIGNSTARIPSTPMHWVLQTETNLDGYAPADSVAGHVLVDWVAVYTPA